MADTYLWTQVSGPGPATIVSPTALVTVINAFPAAGVYEFLLLVTRDGEDYAWAIGTVSVQSCSHATPCTGYPLPLVHQFFDQIADPAHDYKLWTYAAGTETPLATYHDRQLTVENPNPLTVDGSARDYIFVAPGVFYDLVMKDIDGNVIWSREEWSWTALQATESTAPGSVRSGTITMLGTATIPTGWILCNGQPVSRSTYLNLFNAIGTTFGAGNGSTTFNVPNLVQRFPFGVAATGTGSVLGATAGSIDHVHTGPSHTHTIASHTHALAHTHTVPYVGWSGAQAVGTGTSGRALTNDGSAVNLTEAQNENTTGAVSAPNSAGTALTTSEGGTSNTGAANPALLALNFIIKT